MDPPEFLVLSQLVARRNAMELEQHLGLQPATRSGEWPIFQNIQLLPMPNHTNIDSTIHIDLLPTFGTFIPLPMGNHNQLLNCDVIDPSADATTTSGEIQWPLSSCGVAITEV